MSLSLPHTVSSLQDAGIGLRDEYMLYSTKRSIVQICVPLLLLTSPLPPLYVGFILGFGLVSWFAFKAWIGVTVTNAVKNSFLRPRLVCQSSCRCPLLRVFSSWVGTCVPTEMYKLHKLGKEARNELVYTDTDFVDIWNMWPLTREFEHNQEVKSRQTHSVIVEVIGSQLRLLYPVQNWTNELIDSVTEVEIFSCHHSVDLSRANVTLIQPEGDNVNKMFNKRWPICVKSSTNSGTLVFYPFPILKRNKEFLFKLLRIRTGQLTEHDDLDRRCFNEDMVMDVIREYRMFGQEDPSLEMMNVVLNRLRAKLLFHEMIFRPIQKIFKKKLANKFGNIFKNFRLHDFDTGDRLPLVTKIEDPYNDERGLWVLMNVNLASGHKYRSFTIEANTLNLPDVPEVVEMSDLENSSDSDTDSEKEVMSDTSESVIISPATPMLIAQLFDREIHNLSFTLDILKMEMILQINIPPPDSFEGRIWIGLAKLPTLDIKIQASGATDLLNNVLNSFMPVIKGAILSKLYRTMETKWVFPHMKDLVIPFFQEE